MAEPKVQNEVPVQEPDNTKVNAGVEAAEAAKEQAENAQHDKDWEDRVTIFKEKNGREPDPDTELEGLDNLINDEELGKWREKNSPRGKFVEYIKTNRPDGKYDEDEQEVFRQASDLIDKLQVDKKKYDDMTKNIMRNYDKDPEETAAVLEWLADGTPFVDALVKYKGEDALTMKEGMEGWDSYQKAIADRRSDREKYVQLMDEIDGNMKASTEGYGSWADEHGLDEKQREDVWKMIQTDLDNLSRGKIGKDLLDRYLSVVNHDADVEGAYEQGKAEGENAQIEAKKKQMQGSGLPNGNGGGAKEPEEKELSPREQLAQRMQSWRRG